MSSDSERLKEAVESLGFGFRTEENPNQNAVISPLFLTSPQDEIISTGTLDVPEWGCVIPYEVHRITDPVE